MSCIIIYTAHYIWCTLCYIVDGVFTWLLNKIVVYILLMFESNFTLYSHDNSIIVLSSI